MMIHSKVFLLIGIVLMAANTFGCASASLNGRNMCDKLTAPDSEKVYLFVSKEYEPHEKIVQAVKQNTVYALLQKIKDVKIIDDVKSVKDDGVLLQIDIIRSFRGGVSKRIDIRYQLINTANQEVMIEGTDAVKSRFGYNKITIALGNRLARKVGNILRCLEKQSAKELSTEN